MQARVFQIVSRVLGIPVDQITMESSPKTITAWDSLKHMNLLLSLEEELSVRFTDREMVDAMNVGRIVQIIDERAGSSGA